VDYRDSPFIATTPFSSFVVPARAWELFIEVNKGDRFDFVAEYDPKCLTEKTYTAIAVTYN